MCNKKPYETKWAAKQVCIQTGLPCGMQCLSEETCNRKETLEEAIKRLPLELDYSEFDGTSFELGAKWQQEQQDAFAIGFADWFHENCYEEQIGYYTASDLLETYKREVLNP
jgi:hypothetical protein